MTAGLALCSNRRFAQEVFCQLLPDAMKQNNAPDLQFFSGSPEGRVFEPLSGWRVGRTIGNLQRDRALVADCYVRAIFVVVFAPFLHVRPRVVKSQEPNRRPYRCARDSTARKTTTPTPSLNRRASRYARSRRCGSRRCGSRRCHSLYRRSQLTFMD